MTLNCFKCNQEVVFDSDHIGKNGKKIPLDPSTHQPHDCPMREKRTISTAQTGGDLVHGRYDDEEDKDDHGNEDFKPTIGNFTDESVTKHMASSSTGYVDHTATTKGLSKVKIFLSEIPFILEKEYNEFLAENNGKIKTQGAQFQFNTNGFAIALYYEEQK